MTAGRFHMGWFLNFVADEWNGNWGDGGHEWTGEFYVDLARAMERACMDYVIIEDKLMVSDAYGGTMGVNLKHGIAPKHDPVPLAVLIAQATSRVGVVPTMSTSFYPPFLLARLCSTIDHISGGRLGWNIVTSGEDQAAQNFGLDKLYEHDERYAMATEYLDLVCQLWESWEPEAVVRDRETGTYADHTKVHTINFEGQYYKSRGPLNTVRAPQGRPVLCQAGASPKGRDFAARYADTVIAYGGSTDEMKAFRNDIRARMIDHGRKPDDCKVMFIIQPIMGDTEEEARATRRRWFEDPLNIEAKLAGISSITEVDFAPYEWDEVPPEDLTTNAERNSLETFLQKGSGRTLRQLVTEGFGTASELIGTPDAIAERMGTMMEEVGGDGFLVNSPFRRVSRRYVTEITDGLIPALQRRGLVRTAYTYEQFRDNLLEF